MVTQIINADPSAIKAVRVDRSSALSEVLPSLAVGQTLDFTVRQNGGGGRGLIAFRGNLVSAELPASLQTGDVVHSRIESADNQLVFRILNVGRPAPIQEVTTTTRVAAALQQLVDTVGPQGLKPSGSFELPPLLEQAGLRPEHVEKLFQSLGPLEQLAESKASLTHVLASSNGQLASALRESAAQIRQHISTFELRPEQQLALIIKEQLTPVLNQLDAGEVNIGPRISRLIESLTQQKQSLVDEKSQNTGRHTLVERALQDLSAATNQAGEVVRTRLDSLMTHLEQVINDGGKQSGRQLDPNAVSKLHDVAVRLEQLAGTQELLAQLNPAMQTLGEPAMILFPFLFQGLIAQSEVTVEPRHPWKKGDKDAAEEGSGATGGEPYQRIQVTVPLPAIGTVGVDIAHRSEEILVRFVVPTDESQQFLDERLEELAAILREQGFPNTELVADVGEVPDASPPWATALQRQTSIVA